MFEDILLRLEETAGRTEGVGPGTAHANGHHSDGLARTKLGPQKRSALVHHLTDLHGRENGAARNQTAADLERRLLGNVIAHRVIVDLLVPVWNRTHALASNTNNIQIHRHKLVSFSGST